MKYIELITQEGTTHFVERESSNDILSELGYYSQKINAKTFQFRRSKQGKFDWHPAPQTQFIIYLSGRVKITVGEGQQREFCAGDVLLANDLTGEGHVSEVIEEGDQIIVSVISGDFS